MSESKPFGHASLAVYAHADVAVDFPRLNAEPTRNGVKGDLKFWIFSTKGRMDPSQVEEHLAFLIEDMIDDVAVLSQIAAQGFEMRLWIYFEAKSENASFVISPQVLEFSNRISADICVDVWS